MTVGNEFLILDDVFPQSATLCRQPQIAIIVFIDINNQVVHCPNTFKVVLRSVIAVQACHGRHPDTSAAIIVDGVAAGVVERVRISRLTILIERSLFHIQYNHTTGIGAYPQLIIYHTEGMYIQSA